MHARTTLVAALMLIGCGAKPLPEPAAAAPAPARQPSPAPAPAPASPAGAASTAAATTTPPPTPPPADHPRTETRDVPCTARTNRQPAATRLAVAKTLLAKGTMLVHLDPKPSSVIVPERFKQDVRLILAVGTSMHIPIPDLKVDASGISGTLSFDRTPFFCRVPWSTVYALTTNDEDHPTGEVWPDSVPEALWCKE